ncbi:MAG: hypothetical protein PHT13_03390 [Methanosarcina sp.]|nr:hypothetical protein [Methanosarcina sp.]
MGGNFHFVFGGSVSDGFLIHNSLEKTSLELEKPPPEGKESLNLKKPCRVPLIKMQKSRVFCFSFLTNVFRGD